VRFSIMLDPNAEQLQKRGFASRKNDASANPEGEVSCGTIDGDFWMAPLIIWNTK